MSLRRSQDLPRFLSDPPLEARCGPTSGGLATNVGGARELAFVVTARTGLVGLSLITSIMVVRVLGPSDFGAFALCIAYVKLFASFLGDALDNAVVRQAPVYLVEDRPRAIGLIQSSFSLRLVAGLLLFAVTLVFAPQVAPNFFGETASPSLLIVASLGILGDLLMRSALSYFQSSKSFGRLLAVEFVVQAGRFGLVAGVALAGQLDASKAVSIFVGVPFVAFAIGVMLAPRDLFVPQPSGRSEMRSVLHYSKWMVLAGAAAAVCERLDLFLLGHFRGLEDTGIYAAALLLATVPEIIEGGIGTVLNPRIVEENSAGRFRALQRIYLRWAVPSCLGALVVAFAVAPWGIETFLSPRYVDAIPIFKIQIVGALFWMALGPPASALVAYTAPQRLVLFATTSLFTRAALGLTLIPFFGVTGAAIGYSATRIILALCILWLGGQAARSGPGVGEASTASATPPR